MRVITEHAPQCRHRVVDRVRSDHDADPDLVEQLLDADEHSGVLGEAQKKLHRPVLELDGLAILRNLVERRIDAPSADAQCGAVHSRHWP